jgi:alginate O-acetyltransferase complex protein AlgI
MLTMTLGGLWHGASWTFVVWGVLHGACLIVNRLFRRLCDGRPRLNAVTSSRPGVVACWALTLLCVLVGWVFFRAQTFSTAAGVLSALFVRQSGKGLPLPGVGLWATVALLVVCHVIGRRRLWPVIQKKLPAPVLGAGYALALTLALLLAPPSGKAFIYFAF